MEPREPLSSDVSEPRKWGWSRRRRHTQWLQRPLQRARESPYIGVGLTGTVLAHMWWKVALVVAYTLLVCIFNFSVVKMNFSPALVPILGTVVGFLLVFRTNTAYDRYYEGRKVWSGMNQACRRLICCIWVWIATEADPEKSDRVHDMLAEKRSMVNCVLAFPVAVKHYLREEYRYDYEDLRVLIGALAPFQAKLRLQAAQPPQKMANTSNVRSRRRQARRDKATANNVAQTCIPMEIVHAVAIYMRSVVGRKLCDPSCIVTMNLALTCLIEHLGSFERILRTPLPLAYSVHLHHALWTYILSLLFQLVSTCGWWTIPAVGFTSFTLLGILEIGWEIENPFGYDDNDLPLDDFCDSLRKEVEQLIGNQDRAPVFEDLYKPDNDSLNKRQMSMDSSRHGHGHEEQPHSEEPCTKFAELSAQSLALYHSIAIPV